MTTLTQNILPIPESTVQGSGGYTVPANKTAKLSASTNVSYETVNQGSTSTTTAIYWYGKSIGNQSQIFDKASLSNRNIFDLVEGDSITVQTSFPSAAPSVFLGSYNPSSTNGVDRSPYSRVLINGTVVLESLIVFRARHDTTANSNCYHAHQSSGNVGWSAAIFPIPKNNLPTDLIEGN